MGRGSLGLRGAGTQVWEPLLRLLWAHPSLAVGLRRDGGNEQEGRRGTQPPRLCGGPPGSRRPCPHLSVPTPQASVAGPRSLSLAICHSESPWDARPCSARVSRWPGDSLVKADPSRGHTAACLGCHCSSRSPHPRRVCLSASLFTRQDGQAAGSVWTPPPGRGHRTARTDAQPGVCRPCWVPRTAPIAPIPVLSFPDESRGAAADGSRL